MKELVGSHQKIYNWTYYNGAQFSCSKAQKEQPFPNDINWLPLSVTDESLILKGKTTE